MNDLRRLTKTPPALKTHAKTLAPILNIFRKGSVIGRPGTKVTRLPDGRIRIG